MSSRAEDQPNLVGRSAQDREGRVAAGGAIDCRVVESGTGHTYCSKQVGTTVLASPLAGLRSCRPRDVRSHLIGRTLAKGRTQRFAASTLRAPSRPMQAARYRA